MQEPLISGFRPSRELFLTEDTFKPVGSGVLSRKLALVRMFLSGQSARAYVLLRVFEDEYSVGTDAHTWRRHNFWRQTNSTTALHLFKYIALSSMSGIAEHKALR